MSSRPSESPADERNSSPLYQHKGRLFTLFASSSLTVLAAAIIAPSLNAMKLRYSHVENVELLVQMILTTPALFIVIGSPIAGWCADRFGRKPVLLTGLVFYAVAGSTGVYLDNLFAILAGRAALGLAVAGVMTGATTLLADFYEGKQRIQILGIQAAFMGLGGVIFLLLGGYLAEFNWRYPYATYLLSLLIVPTALLYIREPEQEPQPTAGTAEAAASAKMPWDIVIPAVCMVFTIEVCFYLVPVQVPFRFANLGFEEPWRVSVAISCVSGFFSVIASQASRLRELFGLSRCFFVGFATSGVALIGIGLIESFGGLIIPFCLMGGGFGLIIPNLTAWIAAGTTQQVRGRAMGIYSAFLFFGQFMSPLVSQPLVKMTSVSTMYVIAATCCLVAAPIAAKVAPLNTSEAAEV